MFVVSYLNKTKSFVLQLMYNKLKQILYFFILILAPLINNSSSTPRAGHG